MAKPRFTRRLHWLLTSFRGRRTASTSNEKYKATYCTSLIIKVDKKLRKKIASLACSKSKTTEKKEEKKKLWKVPFSPFCSLLFLLFCPLPFSDFQNTILFKDGAGYDLTDPDPVFINLSAIYAKYCFLWTPLLPVWFCHFRFFCELKLRGGVLLVLEEAHGISMDKPTFTRSDPNL